MVQALPKSQQLAAKYTSLWKTLGSNLKSWHPFKGSPEAMSSLPHWAPTEPPFLLRKAGLGAQLGAEAEKRAYGEKMGMCEREG